VNTGKLRVVAGSIALFACAVSIASAQESQTITGTVLDRSSSQPVVGARVVLQNTRFGTTTNATGGFQITGLRPATYVLVVTHAGYLSTRSEIVVQTGAPVVAKVQLDALVLSLQQLVTTGSLGHNPGPLQPFGVARLGTNDLQTPTGGSLMAALTGKIAGVSVLGRSGVLGPGVTTQFRSNMENGKTPLIVVDGVILSRSTDGDVDIDPAEIESIEVLKGPAAAAVYGARSEAGVIVIETAGGQGATPGEIRTDYRMETTLDYVGRRSPVSQHHAFLMSPDGTQLVDTAGAPVGLNGVLDRNHPFADRPYPFPLYDNVRALFPPSHGLRQRVTLSKNGDNAAWSFTLGRIDQGGVMLEHSGSTQNRARLSFDYRMGDRFELGLDGSYVSLRDDPIATDAFGRTLTAAPFLNFASKGSDGRYVDYVWGYNPARLEAETDDTGDGVRKRAGMRARYTPLGWLTLDAQFGYDRSDRTIQSNFPTTNQSPAWAGGSAEAYNGSVGAVLRGRRGRLDWQSRFGAGLAREETRDSTGYGSITPFALSASWVDFRDYTTRGGLAYDDRYFFDAGFVYDDVASYWGDDARRQPHYRAGIAYRISAERWFRVPLVSDLTLTFATGRVRNHSLPMGAVPTVGGPLLRRPTTWEHEVGLNSVLLKERASLALTYARQSSRDLIYLVSETPSQGQSGLRNVGGMIGQTLEATIQARIVARTDVVVDVSAVGGRMRNEINDWPFGCLQVLNPSVYACNGDQRGDFSGPRFLRSAEELPTAMTSRASEFQVNDDGYLVWVGPGNTYRDGIAKSLWGTTTVANGTTYRWGLPVRRVDEAGSSRWHLGSSLPDFAYSIHTNARWKSLSAHAEMRGQIGGQVYNRSRKDLLSIQRHPDIDQGGRPDELKKPLTYYGQLAAVSEPFVEDASYLKLGAIEARIRLDHKHLMPLFGRMAPSSVSVGLTGRNLLTLTGYSGFDPEAGSPLDRTETWDYPSVRTIVATVDITF
jgi:TonB-dependent SusC/RagA subfamily outer membrane receptor